MVAEIDTKLSRTLGRSKKGDKKERLLSCVRSMVCGGETKGEKWRDLSVTRRNVVIIGYVTGPL